MTGLELASTVVGTLVGMGILGGLFVHLVALPYLQDHLIAPLLERLEAMQEKDSENATAWRLAAGMFEGHMTASEQDRSHLWSAVHDLQRRVTP